MADNNDEWTEVASAGSGDTWDFDTNPVIVGVYVRNQENVGPNNSHIYHIETENNPEPVGVWGSSVLDGKFEEIEIGSLVKIEYLGKVQGKTNRYKDYKVFVKKPSTNNGLGDVA